MNAAPARAPDLAGGIDPQPPPGRVVRLWERRWSRGVERRPRWEPITFREMLAGIGGGLYTRTAALAIEAMVRGETFETAKAKYRFRSEADRREELNTC